MSYATKTLYAFVLLSFAVTASAQAAPSTAWTYQGQLKSSGVPYTGPAAFEFSLWDAELEGRPVGDPVRLELDVVNGLFTASLDFGPDAFNGEPRWLEISLRTDRDSGVLAPRQPITAAPFALYALSARGGGTSLWQQNGADIYYNAGRVGVGTSAPQYSFHAEASTTNGRGVFGLADASANSGVGVFGQADHGTGRGVIGYASDASGVNFAVVGQTDSDQGYAAYFTGGRNYFEGNLGAGTLDPQYPVHAELDAASGRAIYGKSLATATNGVGVYGQTEGTGGRGVVGYASSPSGTNFGVLGYTESSTGYAGYFQGGRNYFQGRVGIGNNNPQHALDVSGDVEADQYRFSTPQEKHLTLGAYAFQPQHSGTTYSRIGDELYGPIGVDARFMAQVTLPQGATITHMTAYAYDATTSKLTVTLASFDFPGSGGLSIASVETSLATGAQTLEATIPNVVVDNLSKTYIVEVYSAAWTNNLRFQAVVLTYTVDEVP